MYQELLSKWYNDLKINKSPSPHGVTIIWLKEFADWLDKREPRAPDVWCVCDPNTTPYAVGKDKCYRCGNPRPVDWRDARIKE